MFGGKTERTNMDARLFYDRVCGNEELEWLGSVEGVKPDEDGVIVGCATTGHKFFFSMSSIIETEWETLEDVLYGRRQPRIMTHVTRIVGYYSQLQNWNHSKLAELRDRHKGNYSVPDQAVKKEVARSAGLEPAVSRSATLCPIH